MEPVSDVVTLGRRVAEALPAGTLICARTVEGEPARLRAMTLTLTQESDAPFPAGLCRYRRVYKLFSTEPWTSPNSTRRSWRGGIPVPPMALSGTRRSSSQGPSTLE